MTLTECTDTGAIATSTAGINSAGISDGNSFEHPGTIAQHTQSSGAYGGASATESSVVRPTEPATLYSKGGVETSRGGPEYTSSDIPVESSAYSVPMESTSVSIPPAVTTNAESSSSLEVSNSAKNVRPVSGFLIAAILGVYLI